MSNIIYLGQVRKMWFAEKLLFRDHLLRLDKDSRRMRFGMSVCDDFIHEYVGAITETTNLIHGFFKDGKMLGAAELRQIGETWQPDAEAAFSVEKTYQNIGIGSELMGRVIRSARNRNIKHLHISCLADNGKMQHIAKRYDASLKFSHGEVIGELTPSRPTYLSLWEEAVDDGSGWMMAALNLHNRYIKAA